MTQRQVLVAYATRNGSTAEIAVQIGDVLREAGFAVRVRPARDVRSLRGVSAVILGSALYANRWRAEARRFARRFEAALCDRAMARNGMAGDFRDPEYIVGWANLMAADLGLLINQTAAPTGGATKQES
jgi:menaquinone-dependent protoporphyrinogen IX oxidase